MTKTKKPFDGLTKELQATQKCVSLLLDEWIGIMGLSNWKIDVEYFPEHRHEAPGTDAMVNPSWEYKFANMRVYLPRFMHLSKKSTEYIIIHELCHCLINPVCPKHSKLEELVVTEMTQAFMRLKYQAKPLK